ncbi:unnamed protein product [Protopolystoma xenopodis]|uniref:Uncharacterized protein n=1 Tax=Protopolystoma xenopodis TaxID=117903 RepID=A0A3S5CIS3_9PLAT|nr:unnamed protein product [Protopolystoma xenopodis]
MEEIKRQAAKAAVAAAAALTGGAANVNTVVPGSGNTCAPCLSDNGGSPLVTNCDDPTDQNEPDVANGEPYQSPTRPHTEDIEQEEQEIGVNYDGKAVIESTLDNPDNSGDHPRRMLRRNSSSCVNLFIHGTTSATTALGPSAISLRLTQMNLNSRQHTPPGMHHCDSAGSPTSLRVSEADDGELDAPEVVKRGRISLKSASERVTGSDISQPPSGPLASLQAAKTAAVSE